MQRFSDEQPIVKRCSSPICNNLIYQDQWGWSFSRCCPDCTQETKHYLSVTGIATRVDKKQHDKSQEVE